MDRKRVRRNDRIQMRIIIVVAIVLLTHMCITTIRGNTKQRAEFEQQRTEWERQKAEYEKSLEEKDELLRRTTEQQETEVDKYAVFDTMSQDWGDEIEGFQFYEIPEEYKETGGYFPEIMQIYTYCLCKQEGVEYSLIVAMIEHESGYKFDNIGDNGESFGYMQINRKANTDLCEELGCTDLLNPYQNVRVGIARMKELLEKYNTMQDALTAYNYGERGAWENMWSKGKYVYKYNREIIARSREIKEVLQQ